MKRVTKSDTNQTLASKITTHLDWLSYTIVWPNEPTPKTKRKKAIEQKPSPLGRSASGQINANLDPQNLIDAAIPKLVQQVMKPVQFNLSTMSIDELKNAKQKRWIGNYDRQVELEVGALVYHSTRASQGLHVQLNGDDLTKLRQAGIDEKALIVQLLLLGARFTRLDICLDVRTNYTTARLSHHDKLGRIKTPAKTRDLRQSDYIASTLYFGSPTSTRRVRVYDKGQEQKVDFGWLRIEPQLRDEQAAEWASFIAENGVSAACSSCLKAFFPTWRVLHGWLRDLPDLAPIQVGRVARPGSDKWLRTVAVPAVLTALAIDDSNYGDQLRQQVIDILSAVPARVTSRKSKSSVIEVLQQSKIKRQRMTV